LRDDLAADRLWIRICRHTELDGGPVAGHGRRELRLHGGASTAKMTLDLKPDGTWTQTWTERGRTVSDSGRWAMQGRSVVLESGEGSRRRVTLRRQADGLYGLLDQSWLGGKSSPMTIEFHRAETNPNSNP
jgi:hypothetical protein